MNRIRIPAAVTAALLLLATAGTARAQDGADLSLRLAPGDSMTYVVETQSERGMMGQTMQTVNTEDWRITVERFGDDGAHITAVLDRVRRKGNNPRSGEYDQDSTREEDLADPRFAVTAAGVGQGIRGVLHADGTVTVTDGSAYRDAVLAAAEQAPDGGRMMQFMERTLSDEALAGRLDGLFAVRPEGRVGTGDSWTRTSEPAGMGFGMGRRGGGGGMSMTQTETYKVTAMDDATVTTDITTDLEVEVPEDAPMEMEAEIMESSGTAVLRRDRGILKSLTSRTVTSISIDSERGQFALETTAERSIKLASFTAGDGVPRALGAGGQDTPRDEDDGDGRDF